MPHVQKMHDRYKDRGLLLLAISYEKKNVLQPFLTANSYTMPVGSDPSRKVIDAFHIRGWPSSFLIDKEGKIAFVGGPYSVEPAIEEVLGLESSPQSLLDLYLKALAAKKPAAIRDALTRLTEKDGLAGQGRPDRVLGHLVRMLPEACSTSVCFFSHAASFARTVSLSRPCAA